jgi:exonuclease VII small subunit
MARARRSSSVLETARQRLAGLKSFTREPDLGPAITVANYEQELTTFSTSLDSYNERLAALDEMLNSLETAENSLRDKNKRVLSAVGAQFGTDSSEYEQAGGTRQSERKRSPGRPRSTKGSPTP